MVGVVVVVGGGSGGGGGKDVNAPAPSVFFLKRLFKFNFCCFISGAW